MVAKAHWLGHLQMGVAGQDGVGFALCNIQQRIGKGVQCGDGLVSRITQKQADIGGHLVVA